MHRVEFKFVEDDKVRFADESGVVHAGKVVSIHRTYELRCYKVRYIRPDGTPSSELCDEDELEPADDPKPK